MRFLDYWPPLLPITFYTVTGKRPLTVCALIGQRKFDKEEVEVGRITLLIGGLPASVFGLLITVTQKGELRAFTGRQRPG